jgi:hypothetical protein
MDDELHRKILDLLTAGRDPAYISTYLRCRFSLVQEVIYAEVHRRYEEAYREAAVRAEDQEKHFGLDRVLPHHIDKRCVAERTKRGRRVFRGLKKPR